jgi:hypothetical protein
MNVNITHKHELGISAKPRHTVRAESPWGANQLDDVIRAIRVRDANGDELTLYEYRQAASARTILGLNRNGATRLALDTGEPAERVNDETFVIVASGERLARIP